MKKTEIKARQKYIEKSYDMLSIRIRKDENPSIDALKAFCKLRGYSTAGFVWSCVRDRMLSEGYTPTAAPQDTETETETETDTNNG